MKIHNVYLAKRKAGVVPVREDDVEPLVLEGMPVDEGHAVAVIEHEYELSDQGKTFRFSLDITPSLGDAVCRSKQFRKTFDNDERPPLGRHTALITDCRVQISDPSEYQVFLAMASSDGDQTYRFPIPSKVEASVC